MKKEKITVKELVWLFILGCLLGFVLETAWYYIKHGVFINKQGLLYGPFKPIYGFGLDLIVLAMYKFQDKNIIVKFLIGFVVGSLFEYISSLFQEYVLGTATWSYASFNYNIGGRIYLPYCLAWGIIGVLCINYVYPYFKKIAGKCPEKIGNILTVLVSIFMVINISLSALAILRYQERTNKIEASNIVFKQIDKLYPDELMKKKFPKLKVVK